MMDSGGRVPRNQQPETSNQQPATGNSAPSVEQNLAFSDEPGL